MLMIKKQQKSLDNFLTENSNKYYTVAPPVITPNLLDLIIKVIFGQPPILNVPFLSSQHLGLALHPVRVK